MSRIILPASCYEEALPDLRAPYLASQIRPLVINAPKNDQAPCLIGLYTIGETLMDRFNLCCATNWSVVFNVETHKEHQKEDDDKKPVTIHYYKIACSVTVFGNEHSDFGEGEGPSEALAEFNARAQAFKRAARWHGPGQCLYVFGGEELKMWRGPEEGKLHVPKSGTEPHRRPFFDKASRQAVRDEYAKWLHDEGEGQFGVALNHLKIAEGIRERAIHSPSIAVPDLSKALPELTDAPAARETPEHSEDRNVAAAPQPPAAIQSSSTSEQRTERQPTPAAPPADESQRLPMPDAPASQEAVDIAVSAGFTAAVAHALSNLARTDGQEGTLSERQHKGLVNWLVVLSELNLTSEEIVQAVRYVGDKGSVQEKRQATFARWVAAKASGRSVSPEPQPSTTSDTDTETDAGGDSDADAESAAQEAPDAATIATGRALNRIHKAMSEQGYTDRTVALMGRLSIGLSPKRKLAWADVPPATMTVLAELLESAAAIGWSDDVLGKEVRAAHDSKTQPTVAGRFSAFAGHLTELAEDRLQAA